VDKRQVTGLVGSALLFLGVFMPIISVPIVGNVNYFANGKGDGIFVLLFAAIAAGLAMAKKHKGQIITGLGSLGVMIFTFVNFQTAMAEAKAELAGNPFAALTGTVQMQFGWIILIAGIVALFASAGMKPEE